MEYLYKFIPPPCSSIKKLEKNSTVNENGDLHQIDVGDANLLQILQNIQASYEQNNFKFLYDEMKNICDYLSDKKIPQNLPYFRQFQIIEIINSICSVQQIEEIIDILDLAFYLMYVLTKNHYYLNLFPLEVILRYLDVDIIYTQTDWYFKLLSNYALEFASFDPSCINPIVTHIQNIQNHAKIVNILKFLEDVTRFRFISKENPISSDNISQLSRTIIIIINYIIGTFYNSNKQIINSISVILEKLTRKKHLDIQSFSSMNITQFIRSNYTECPKLIKMIGYYIYHYGEHDIDFVMIASHMMKYKLDAECNKYSLWTLYNMIKIDEKCLFKDDSEYFNAADSICQYLIDNLDSLPFYIKRQGILLISLMYSVAPITVIRNEVLLENILDYILIFCEDKDDKYMAENIFNFLVNVYELIQISKNNIASTSLIPLFYRCRDDLMLVYLDTNEEKYTVLQEMI